MTLTSLLQIFLGLRYKNHMDDNAKKRKGKGQFYMNFKEANVVVTSALSEEERVQALSFFLCILRIWMIMKTVTVMILVVTF